MQYSTSPQIGHLFMAVGLSQHDVALLRLVDHAFLKALLILAVGAVTHGMADQQDLRRLDSLVSFLPFTYTAILSGSLSLIAFPFLTGFYSKDLILELGDRHAFPQLSVTEYASGFSSPMSSRLPSLKVESIS